MAWRDEVARAVAAAEPHAAALRRPWDNHMAALETALAEMGAGAVQVGRSGAMERWVTGRTERHREDYAVIEAVAADPRAVAADVARALHRAHPHDLLHYREGPRGWEVAVGAALLLRVQRAPNLSGRPAVELSRGPAARGAFAEVDLALLPEQALLYDLYAEMGGAEVYGWSAEEWAAAFAREARLCGALEARVRGAAEVVEGGAAPGALAAEAQRRGWPLVGEAAELAVRGADPAGAHTLACLAEDSEQAAHDLARAAAAAGIPAEVRRMELQLPGADAAVWVVSRRERNGPRDLAKVSNLAELVPVRAHKGRRGLVAGAPAQLRYQAGELWTVETLARRGLLHQVTAAGRQRAILAEMRAARARLRDVAREWGSGELYGTAGAPRRRRGRLQADPQFPKNDSSS